MDKEAAKKTRTELCLLARLCTYLKILRFPMPRLRAWPAHKFCRIYIALEEFGTDFLPVQVTTMSLSIKNRQRMLCLRIRRYDYRDTLMAAACTKGELL